MSQKMIVLLHPPGFGDKTNPMPLHIPSSVSTGVHLIEETKTFGVA